MTAARDLPGQARAMAVQFDRRGRKRDAGLLNQLAARIEEQDRQLARYRAAAAAACAEVVPGIAA